MTEREKLIDTVAWAISVTRRKELNDKDRQQMAKTLVDRLDEYLATHPNVPVDVRLERVERLYGARVDTFIKDTEHLLGRIEKLEKRFEPIVIEGDSYGPNGTVAIVDSGPVVCAGCGAPGFFGERPSEANREHAKRTNEDPRALHWEVRGARVCLECFNKERR